jgi:hypothetical protein
MKSDFVLKSYLLVSPTKIAIVIRESLSLKEIYKKEIILNNNLNTIKLEYLNDFLDQNIFEIEKILKKFIKNIYLIIDTDQFFPTQISIKKQNNGNLIDSKSLVYLLNDAKDQCEKTIADRKIIHMIIENYLIDNKNYSFLPKDIRCNKYCLDIKFISISKNLIKDLENILKKYQISIDQILSAKYVNDFFPQNEHNLFDMAQKIVDGCNENEIKFVNKSQKNKGFFEKFFNLFS